MEILDEKSSVKDRILDDLGKSIKLVRRIFLYYVNVLHIRLVSVILLGC